MLDDTPPHRRVRLALHALRDVLSDALSAESAPSEPAMLKELSAAQIALTFLAGDIARRVRADISNTEEWGMETVRLLDAYEEHVVRAAALAQEFGTHVQGKG
ncbi:hypothetical protein ACQPZF_27360 [Actinosynnema sp. CS-041913]|uniref:hypothetical protein n=1 Tax=Actinosynnema sp. CS-041913 TaxID=3239917 RepID=UPI003D910A37